MKVLLVAYGGGHVAMLAPVSIALRSLGHDVVFLALTTAQQYLDKKEIPYIGFKDIQSCQQDDIQLIGKNLTSGQLPGPVSLAESIAYMGASYADLISDFGQIEAQNIYNKSGRQAFFPVRTLRNLISSLAPDLVVATNSPRAERAAIVAAGELGLPSVCLVDMFALQEVQWIGKPGYATKICVLNEAVRQMFLEHGRSEDEVIITGNPAFDRLFEPEVMHLGDKLRSTRGWSDGKISLLWASQVEPLQHPFSEKTGDPTLPRRIEAVLRQFVKTNKRFRLIVRYHPSEQIKFRPQRNVEYSPTSEDLPSLLHAVDCVIVTSSTVGLEASLIGKPVISVDASIFTEDAPYSKMGVSIGATDESDLPYRLLELFSPTGSPALPVMQENLGLPKKNEALATKNIVNVIESLYINQRR